MKKIISLIAVTSILLMGLVSCNIDAPRAFSGSLTVKVTNLPASVKAVSFWGTPNEWKLANIQEEADKYIVDVVDGIATFDLGTYVFSDAFQCQIVPMTSKSMTMDDSTWWQYAFSGSSAFDNAENNLVYDFANGASNPMTLVLDISDVYGDTSGVFKKRFNTEDYTTAFKME